MCGYQPEKNKIMKKNKRKTVDTLQNRQAAGCTELFAITAQCSLLKTGERIPEPEQEASLYHSELLLYLFFFPDHVVLTTDS